MIPLYDRMPHFLGSNASEDDLVLTEEQQCQLFRCKVWVQEKLDGLAVAVTRLSGDRLRWQLRPLWQGVLAGELELALDIYFQQRRCALLRLLEPNMILYGEWLWHQLSVHYNALSDLFVGYAMRRPDGVLLSLSQTHRMCRGVGLSCNEPLWSGYLRDLDHLRSFVGCSGLGEHKMEGLIVSRVRRGEWPNDAKWVESDYRRISDFALSGQKNHLARLPNV